MPATRHEVWLIPASPIPVCAVSLRTEVRDVHPPGVVIDRCSAPHRGLPFGAVGRIESFNRHDPSAPVQFARGRVGP